MLKCVVLGFIRWKVSLYKVLCVGFGLASLCTLAACAPASPIGGTFSNANSSQVNETSPSSAATDPTSDSGSWRTISESSISAVSLGGGSNSSDSQSSVSVTGPYQVLAACQGDGSLNLRLQPGGSVTVHCSASERDPARVAGGDTAPTDAMLVVDTRASGNVADVVVLIQERV